MSTIAKTPESYFTNIVLGEKVFGLLPEGTHEWEKFINFEKLKEMIEQKGSMKVIAQKGVSVYNPLTLEMAEVDCLRQNYMVMAKKL